MLTSNTSEQLPSEALDLCAREWCEGIKFQEVEHALAQEVRYYTDVISEVEAIPKMNTLVAVVFVVLCKGGEDSKFNTRSVSILLDGTDDLDSTESALNSIISLDNFSECALSEQATNLICRRLES
jgi:hypothetical protein